MIIKLRSATRFLRSKFNIGEENTRKKECGIEIQWEMRPGGMLVQKRNDNGTNLGDGLITVRVSTVSQWHDITILSTSTFGELKRVMSVVTSLDPKEQRLLFKGKEREDSEYLHKVGVKDKDKVLLFQDPSIREKKASKCSCRSSH